MFTFNKLTESEEKSFQLLEAGNYEFKVSHAEKTTSKSGNPMLVLSLVMYDRFGNQHTLKDWLVSAEHAMCKKKIRDFCFSSGLVELYDAGQLLETDVIGKVGNCFVDSEVDVKGKERNKIMNYIHNLSQQNTETFRGIKISSEEEMEDAIPF